MGDNTGAQCSPLNHIYWFDVADDDPVEGWYTCRDCGYTKPDMTEGPTDV